ncbi:MAG: Smr/MutS family protein [Chitinophagaceae bacterium]|nr:Smr/MutS family protein [Chitinophagaceae bacterium]
MEKLFPQNKQSKYADNIKKEKELKDKITDGVWLSFLPVIDTDEFGDDEVKELKIHLINRTDKRYDFIYRLQFFGKTDFELKNDLHAFSDFYIHDIDFSEMSDSPTFSFVFSLFQPNKEKTDSHEVNFKLKPKQLFAKIEEIKKKGEATFAFKLFDEYPDKVREENGKQDSFTQTTDIYDTREAAKYLPPARTVVDLHIDKLAENWTKLNNYEILNLQLKEFEKYYELALAHQQPFLIVVHGVGSGRLRDEIHDFLRLRKEVKSFVNQYHPSFGYGATEIYFQY